MADEYIASLKRIKATVEATIKDIKIMASDPESAHRAEDKLMVTFIKLVATQDDEIGKIAKLVLSTQKIDFPRWCA